MVFLSRRHVLCQNPSMVAKQQFSWLTLPYGVR
jgi:hypothetical protein